MHLCSASLALLISLSIGRRVDPTAAGISKHTRTAKIAPALAAFPNGGGVLERGLRRHLKAQGPARPPKRPPKRFKHTEESARPLRAEIEFEAKQVLANACDQCFAANRYCIQNKTDEPWETFFSNDPRKDLPKAFKIMESFDCLHTLCQASCPSSADGHALLWPVHMAVRLVDQAMAWTAARGKLHLEDDVCFACMEPCRTGFQQVFGSVRHLSGKMYQDASACVLRCMKPEFGCFED